MRNVRTTDRTMKKAITLSFILCMLFVSSVGAQSWTKKAAKSVFTLKTFDDKGTLLGSTGGFYVGTDGECVSNFEPFRGASRAIIIDAQGSNLWQMGDADDLTTVATHLLHDTCHALGHLAADTRVYLVEDDGGQLHGAADHRLQRQHDTCYLTAGSHLCYGL